MASNETREEPSQRSQKRVDPNKAALRKRQPRRLPKRANDIYVTRKSHFAGQLERCEKLLDAGESEIHIHGLGAATNRALNLALQLESRALGTLQLAVSTATVDLVDDVEPLHDDAEFAVHERTNSAIHIRVFRTASKKADVASS